MTEEEASTDLAWETASELPVAVMEALRAPMGQVVTIVASVDDDGSPRTAALGSVVPISATRLCFGCNRAHATFANIVRDGRVMLALYASPDIAVGIRGRARVLKERLESWPSNAVVEVDVDLVKNDALPLAPVASGITYELPGEVAVRLGHFLDEVLSVGSDSSPPD